MYQLCFWNEKRLCFSLQQSSSKLQSALCELGECWKLPEDIFKKFDQERYRQKKDHAKKPDSENKGVD